MKNDILHLWHLIRIALSYLTCRFTNLKTYEHKVFQFIKKKIIFNFFEKKILFCNMSLKMSCVAECSTECKLFFLVC